jgi:hypothetical protein
MIYITPFFHQFYPNHIKIDFDQLDTIDLADAVAVDFYHGKLLSCIKTINKLLDHTKELYLYLGEPANINEFPRFLTEFDLPNVHFYADCILNFSLKHASFVPTINWFMKPENYYTKYQWAKDLLGKLDYNVQKPYRFDILLGRERSHRSRLNQLILSSTVKNLCIHSYFRNSMSNGIHWDKNINTNSHTLTSELFQINGENTHPSAILPVDIYNQSYYSVVCETTASNEYNQYTEKVAKPIIARRPFVAFAGQYYIKNLKTLGFKTFDSVIDESYDLESNESIRFDLAWKQVEWLCQQDPTYILDQLRPILIHNQQHFLNTDWSMPVKNLF